MRDGDAAYRGADPDDLIRLPEVKRMTGLSKTAIYRRAGEGKFPKSRRIGHRTAVWRRGDVDRWRRHAISIQDLIG